MKNNKGYTLVELIVAVAVLLVVMAEVGALMFNSQRLYRNGFYELNMQENAQQVIEQVETLLMNANPWNKADRSVAARESVITRTESTAGGVPSDVIRINTKIRDYDITGNATGTFTNVTYVIGRDVDLHPGTTMKGTTGKEYSTLYLQRWEGTTMVSEAPMADGVRSIGLAFMVDTDAISGATTEVKTNYLDADLLTLSVVMQNQQYSYTASSETYLRNQPGTGGPTPPLASVSTGGDLDLNVLRVHKYDLRDLLPPADTGKSWHFKWPDADAASMSSKYNLDDSTKTIQCSGLKNNWSASVPEAKIYAAQWTDGEAEDWTDKKEITIHTDPVNNGVALPLYGPTRSDEYVSVYPVTGICTCDSCVNSRTMEAQITLPKVTDTLHLVNVNVISYWPRNEVVTPYDRACNKLLWKSSSGMDIAKPGGGAYAEWDELDELTDYTFKTVASTSPNPVIDLKGCNIEVYPLKHRTGADNDFSTHLARENNYEKIRDFSNNEINQLKLPADGGDWAGEYTLMSIKEGTANAFALRTQDNCTAASGYWYNLVANNGYVRIKTSCTFNNSVTGTYVFYAYVFPKESGGTLQDTLWTMMATPNP